MSYMGTDPGDLTPDEMYGREPIPVATGDDDLEPMDRAECNICHGAKLDVDDKTCWACNGTGVFQTRDELANGERAE